VDTAPLSSDGVDAAASWMKRSSTGHARPTAMTIARRQRPRAAGIAGGGVAHDPCAPVWSSPTGRGVPPGLVPPSARACASRSSCASARSEHRPARSAHERRGRARRAARPSSTHPRRGRRRSDRGVRPDAAPGWPRPLFASAVGRGAGSAAAKSSSSARSRRPGVMRPSLISSAASSTACRRPGAAASASSFSSATESSRQAGPVAARSGHPRHPPTRSRR
jgi:hypothetical protein